MWISLILSQKFNSFRFLHPLKASIPIVIPSVLLLSILTLSKAVHPEKENLGISSQFPGRTTDFNTGLFLKKYESVAEVKYLNSSKFSTPFSTSVLI